MINATQIMGLNQSPSYRLALADRLQAQQRGMNNGTWAGGLASMINAGTAGYLRGKDTRDRDAADEALTGGMTEGAQIGGADGMQPNAPRINPGIEGAEARLAELKGNPYAGRLSGMLALSRAQQEQQAKALQEQRAYQEGLMNQQREWQLADKADDRQWQASNRTAPQRRMMQGPDGVPRYVDTGEPVFPGVEAPPPPTYRTLAPEEAASFGLNVPEGGAVQVAPDGQFRIVQAKQPPQTNVNVNTGDSGPQFGTIPQGEQLIRDPETGAYRMEPIPGGPAARKMEAEAAAAKTANETKRQSADNVSRAIGQAFDIVNSADIPVTGLVGSLTNSIPGTPAHDLANALDTIKGNIGMDRLQAMRDSSPTGGALGQVSEFENRMLQASITALSQSQSREQFMSNLQHVQDIYNRIIHEGISPPQGDIGNGIRAMPQERQQPASGSGTRLRYNPQTGGLEPVR